MTWQWSHYSTALFEAFTSSTENIIVQACPGSGKTTNIRHLCTLAPESEETIYLAFNKAIVEEARSKLPRHIHIMTLNGLGHRAVMSAFGQVKLDDRKVYKLINQLCPMHGLERGVRDEQRQSLFKLVALLKGIVGRADCEVIDDLLTTYDIDPYEGIAYDALTVLKASDNDTETIDFNDQLRFPVLYDLHMPSYDNILGDEVQDFNAIQAALIEKLRGRYILVGDTHQSIYGFRGAMSNSMNHLKEMFHCREMPLNLTYRCPKLVTNEARQLFTDIECLPTADDGIVRYSTAHEEHPIDSLILCRNNGPLINYAYSLLSRDIPCHVRGRDIGQGLVSLINKLGSLTVRALIDDIHVWKEIEILKAEKKDNQQRIQKVNDRVDSLLIFTSRCRLSDPVDMVALEIKALFEQGRGICLSTVHKAKGLEAKDVYILNRELMPSRYATQAWQREQERNIAYVAVTRSKHQLVYM